MKVITDYDYIYNVIDYDYIASENVNWDCVIDYNPLRLSITITPCYDIVSWIKTMHNLMLN